MVKSVPRPLIQGYCLALLGLSPPIAKSWTCFEKVTVTPTAKTGQGQYFACRWPIINAAHPICQRTEATIIRLLVYYVNGTFTCTCSLTLRLWGQGL